MSAAKGKDSFGLWLKPRKGAGRAAEGERDGEGARAMDLSALRAFRAGKGPLASVVCSVGPSRLSADEAAEWDRRSDPFRSPKSLAVVALAMLAGLVAAGAFAARNDLRRLSVFRDLERSNESIHEHNHTRNVLVGQLARNTRTGLARLRGYAAWIDRKATQGVVIFTPAADGSGSTRSVTVDLEDLRQQVRHDIEAMAGWTPPPLLKSHDELRTQTPELLATRLPVSLLFVLAIASVIAWSVRAVGNLPSLDAPALCTRPLRVLACWFAPVAGLYLPCALMGDIWHGSDPGTLHRPGRFRLPVVGLWWLVLMAAGGLLAFATSRVMAAVGPAEMALSMRWALYADLGMVVVGVLTVGLVVAASWNQARRHELIEAERERIGAPALWRED